MQLNWKIDEKDSGNYAAKKSIKMLKRSNWNGLMDNSSWWITIFSIHLFLLFVTFPLKHYTD